jgi:hypothetical protein
MGYENNIKIVWHVNVKKNELQLDSPADLGHQKFGPPLNLQNFGISPTVLKLRYTKLRQLVRQN